MTRATTLLLVLLAAEVLGCGALLAGRLRPRPVPPAPDAAFLDPDTAAELRAAAADCHTAADWRRLGELYMAAGCFPESAGCHRTACELAPGDSTYARQWGFALERLGRLDEANAAYRRAIDAGTADPDACRYLIARNQLRAGDAAAARALFAEGKGLAACRYELARLHTRAGEVVEAEALVRTLTAPPDTLQQYLLSYRLASDRGETRKAARAADRVRYARVKLLNPFDGEAARVVEVTKLLGPGRLWAECRGLIEAGDADGAAARLGPAGDRTPAVVELRAEVAIRQGRLAEAVTLLDEVEAATGPSARIASRRADARASLGDHKRAQDDWLRAARLGAGANLKHVHHSLAASYRLTGDTAAAARHLARGHYQVGRDLLAAGQPGEAVRYFEGAVREDAGLTAGWFYLGEARRLGGATAAAAEAYHTCLRLDPDHGRALAALDLLTPAD